MIRSDAESTPYSARRFGSSEDFFNAPRLTVVYTAPPPFEITGSQLSNNQFQFTIPWRILAG